MSRYRLRPSHAQEAALAGHCAHARYVWNLCVEQESHWRPGRGPMPGFAGRCRQLSEARERKAGRDGGFRIVHVKPGDVRRLNRDTAEVRVPKAGWVRFRWSRPVPQDVKSYRVTRDRAGRWQVAFAAVPDPIPGPGNGKVVGIDRGVAVSAAVTARGGDGGARPVNREPQPVLLPTAYGPGWNPLNLKRGGCQSVRVASPVGG
jgi:putative transposase